MFRLLSHQAAKAIPRPFRLFSGTASRHVHSMKAPYTGPPSYDTIARRFSSQNVRKYFDQKRQQDAMDSDGFIDIHDVKPELITPPDDYDVLISDVTHQTLDTTIAEELGVPYLGEATKADGEEKVRMVDGYTYGPNDRTIIPLVVTHKEVARWVFFILDTGGPWTYLSAEATNALGIQEETGAWVTLGGRKDIAHVVPSKSRFTGVNLLGTSFLRLYKSQVWLDYDTLRARLFFDGQWEVVAKKL